jgi:hypothetical protein
MPVGEARFWLYRVARNMAINEFRKSHTRYRLFDRVVEVMSPRARNPEQEYETQERKTLVLEMLQTLAGRPTHRLAAARAGTVELPRDRTGAEHLGKQSEGRHLSRACVAARTLDKISGLSGRAQD